VDDLDDLAVDGEADLLARPVGRVDVELARVDRQGLGRELVDDRGVAEGMDAHSDLRPVGADVATEDLADADLGRPLGRVLVADQPEGDHRARVIERLRAQLDPTVLRRVEPEVPLSLANDGRRIEPVLTDRASDRARKEPRLQ
jgi:hypothetical protein